MRFHLPIYKGNLITITNVIQTNQVHFLHFVRLSQSDKFSQNVRISNSLTVQHIRAVSGQSE